MNSLVESLSHIRDLIDKGAYERDIEEPTPLEQKVKLAAEVKELFMSDLKDICRISSITSTTAWNIAEDVVGADEALNKGFLYTVLTYIEVLEDFYLRRYDYLSYMSSISR